MRRFLLALAAGLCAATVSTAQEAMPERRLVVSRDMDFYGGDLQALFDTTLDACQALCLNDPACGAFTFNSRSNACFPKTGVSERSAYEGAISAQVVAADPAVRAEAEARRPDLAFLGAGELVAARAEAEALGLRHAGGKWSVQSLLDAAGNAAAQNNLRDALHWTGAALAQSDAADLWLEYGRLSLRYAGQRNGSEKRDLIRRAALASVNGYLRAGPAPQRANAMLQLSEALEESGRGRLMIPALRLAERLGARDDIAQALDRAIQKYGFRITEHAVEADSAAPRICAEFSEPLIRAGEDYTPYVRLPDPRLAVTSDDRRVCVTGVAHGERYTLTFRAGLPSAEGEELVRDVPITAYVRDRAPKVSFPGRAYVLPKAADAGLPVETVNLSEVALKLRRLSDRNLIRAMQDSYFGRPLSGWQDQRFSEELAEEIWTGTGEVENRLNADVTTRLPLGEVVADLPAGIYALTASVPGADPYDDPGATQWFVLSDIGLTTLAGTDGLTVFARALSDAAPLEGLEVTLLSRANRPLGSVLTDAMGVARFAPGLTRGTGGAEPVLVTAARGEEDLAFLSLSDPAFDLSDRGVEGRDPGGPLDAFLATDRGAYRAGEVIHATALLRDQKVAAVAGVPVTAVLTRPDGVEHARIVSAEDVDGGHVFALPLAPSVPRGTWRLALFADPEAPALATQTVLVEDFVPERIDVTLSLPDAPIRRSAPPLLDVEARYLFGAPGTDLPIEGELTLLPRTTLEALPGYRFGRHDGSASPQTRAFPADLRTDAAGVAQLALPLPGPMEGQPQDARITLRVAEGSGRPVERSLTRAVAPAGPMIGIRPEFDGTLPEGSEAAFLLQAVGPALTPVPMAVEWRVNRVTTRYQWYQLYGNWNWEPVTTRSTVASGSAALGAEPLRVTADVDWGSYELVVERSDGAYVASSVGFSAGWYAPADAMATPDTLDLSLDKPAYAPGETAHLRLVPRYAGKALITVLADRVIAMQAVELPEGESVIDLPVTEDWGAGAYVTAQVIRPMDTAAGQNPARSLGLAHAGIDPGDRQLAVRFEAPAESAPRGPLTAALLVDGVAEGETAHVTVAAVDLGILNLTGFDSPDPSGHYFGQRRLGVEIRDLYGRLIDGMNGAMGTIRSGGDADASARLQSPPPTEELVALFSGPVTVGPDGRAEVSFDMPDFNGTVRLMAVAWTGSAVGQAEQDVLVRDSVVLSASLPRFLAPGDSTRMLLEITHATGPTGEMPLRISAEGLTLDALSVPGAVTLGAGETQRLSLPLTAGNPGDHKIALALTTPDGKRLTKTLTVGIRANDPPVGRTRRFTLDPGQSFTLDGAALSGFRREGSELVVSAGPLARFDAPGLLASLDRYPYGCTEQVTSQALPLLYMSALTEPLGLGGKAQIDRRVGQSITKLLTRQAANGAFGLWSAGSGDFWLDAYVSDFLTRARAAGQDVPELALRAALDNLKNRIAYAPDFDSGGEDIAYALMVLAREGQAAIGDLRYYADQRADAFASPLAQAQLGTALASYGDQTRADRMFAKAAARIAGQSSPARVWRADYGSVLRDAAGLLSLAVEARSDAVDREALVTRIAAVSRSMSTQEQAWSLLAAHALVQDPSSSGIALDGTPVSGPFLRRIAGEALDPVQIANTGTGPTPITLTALGVPDGQTEAGGYGYSLTREYFAMDGTPLSGPVRQGDRLVAVLTVRPAEPGGARLMVNDALPAGFEIDNPNLIRAGDIRGLDWLKPAQTEYSEFRSDRFLAAVNQSGSDPIRLAYIVRAVSPGVFHHPAALVEDMYRPDYRATTASGTMVIE
ncbi:alpha-2-macroglobulin family protein [Salipiger sp. P9]|uniref:alpha-2-macroglobulin family protein n=1 Tax=Salipiger pentaromativorans TaxID=2943193 RepID=UPI00215773F0|nr:alpha-2-macroglobulin family protein [Salipiger pentaromativorans]MCR8548284.1 alpha-2-macroglobulin family protein [Salipiger pentaromativorans]